MLPYDAVIFDLDGTLLDTLQDLADATNHVLTENGYPARSLEEIRAFVGNGLEMLMRRALPVSVPEEAFGKLLTGLKEWYAAHNHDATAPYPGIMELLQRLTSAGVRCAIVSNKNDPNVKALARLYFSDTVTLAVGERPGVRRKPAPDTVHEVLFLWRIPEERALYVGDSDVDVETARNSGTPFAGVLWGFRSEECLRRAGADRLFSDPGKLGEYILGNAD